jgi:hypothetical protein
MPPSQSPPCLCLDSSQVWDGEAGALVKTLQGHERGITHGVTQLIAYDLSGRHSRLVSAAPDFVGVWDPEAGALLHTLSDERTARPVVLHLVESEDGRYRLVVGQQRGAMLVVDLGEAPIRGLAVLRAANKSG